MSVDVFSINFGYNSFVLYVGASAAGPYFVVINRIKKLLCTLIYNMFLLSFVYKACFFWLVTIPKLHISILEDSCRSWISFSMADKTINAVGSDMLRCCTDPLVIWAL